MERSTLDQMRQSESRTRPSFAALHLADAASASVVAAVAAFAAAGVVVDVAVVYHSLSNFRYLDDRSPLSYCFIYIANRYTWQIQCCKLVRQLSIYVGSYDDNIALRINRNSRIERYQFQRLYFTFLKNY